ncbi:ABC transporter permease [Echinimonas agarilytica]|uniref:ABC transporter permease n=1 Tax=Echinimonas agarilytica TaxID=1215918 RepID=A0AA41W7J4_9GAMM|nr:ABC transporter permease [Echinimonas agarilytica]MCM2680360.1 ABC transporter permease [Echinimonas agarilytica]
MILKLAYKSLLNRKASVVLTLFSMTVSLCLLISVEHIRSQAKESFHRTVSSVDLIVGARTGQLNLMLYSIFRMGNATNNVSWQSYNDISNQSDVVWSVPLSLGDSHRGYRVLGTNLDYFEFYRYSDKRPLEFEHGKAFSSPFDAVLGAEVAKALNYSVGKRITLSHGIGQVSFSNHDNAPFEVVGVLAPTGTPVDRTVHVSLAGLEAVHMPPSQLMALKNAVESGQHIDVQPTSITAFMLGLKSKMSIFKVQRAINNNPTEPLMAVLPGVALVELWALISSVENILRIISVCVFISAILGLTTMLLSSMRERQKEIAVLRAIGAGPFVLFALIQLEALLLTVTATAVSLAVVWGLFYSASDILASQYGVFVSSNIFSVSQFIQLAVAIGITSIVALLPSVSAYRKALHVGLSPS